LFYGVLCLETKKTRLVRGDAKAHTFESDGLFICGRVRLTNNEQLKLDHLISESLSDLELLVELYKKIGRDLLKKIKGAFSFVVWDEAVLWGARDHLGVYPFYYVRQGAEIHFSDSPIILKNTLGDFKLNNEWLWQYLNYAQMPSDQSLYNDILRLPPAHKIQFQKEDILTERYWSLDNVPNCKLNSEQEILEKFKALLSHAVEARLPEQGVLACELSGGLDSTSVTAFAKELRPNMAVKAFTHTTQNQVNKDERDLVRELCEKYQIESYLVDDEGLSFVDLVKRSLEKFPYPSCNLHYMAGNLYKQAQAHGCKVLFSGFGGDEGVTSYSSTMHCRELIRKGSWINAFQELRSFGHSFKGVLGQWKSAFIYKKPSMVEASPFLRDVGYVDLGYDKFLKNSRDFSVYRLTELSYLSERLENSYHQAEAYGLEYRYPLLDLDLVEFYTSLPTKMKCRAGITRYLIREATKDVLPESIRMRDNKDVPTLPAYEELMKKSLNQFPKFDEVLFNESKLLAYVEELKSWDPNKFYEELDFLEQIIIYSLYKE
jgi:asparagine synthase (glutamine-hydrolysing)